jgi:DNA replication and repair protein RecF
LHLKRLELVDFRNFESATVEFGRRFTVLHGHNGAGKSNILEALYLLSTLRSFRGADLKTMLRRGATAARVELSAHDPHLDVPTQLSVRIDQGARSTRRQARIDGKLIRSAAQFYGRVRAVLFTPEDLAVLRGSPTGRRQFLDRVLFARDRTHIGDVQAYEKLLRSRNRVLKELYAAGDMSGQGAGGDLLASYEAGLASYGAKIWRRRAELVDEIRPGFCAAFEQIHGPSLACSIDYRARIDEQAPAAGEASLDDCETRLAAVLEERRVDDLRRGSTTIGPHRDELEVGLDGALAANFASQGQTRALVLAFKIAELRQARRRASSPLTDATSIPREPTGPAPLLLLDDVSSELDPGRNAQLFETLATEVGQCVLTTTDPKFIHLPSEVERRDLAIEEGRIGVPVDHQNA